MSTVRNFKKSCRHHIRHVLLSDFAKFYQNPSTFGTKFAPKRRQVSKNSKLVVTITFRMFYLVTVPYFNKISTKLFLQATEPFHFHQHLDAKFWTHATHAKILLTHATHAPTRPTYPRTHATHAPTRPTHPSTHATHAI